MPNADITTDIDAAWRGKEPPEAAARPEKIERHGDVRTDPYAWLRDAGYPTVENPEILAYLNAENAYREAVLSPYKQVGDALFEEIKARIKEDDTDPPYPHGPFLYQWREETGKQYAVLTRKRRDAPADAPFETLIDENILAEGLDYFVLATGTARTIRDFLGAAFGHVGLDWQEYVKFDPHFLRPTEVDELIGDASKAHEKLGWQAKVLPEELAQIMVDADIARLEGAPEGSF